MILFTTHHSHPLSHCGRVQVRSPRSQSPQPCGLRGHYVKLSTAPWFQEATLWGISWNSRFWPHLVGYSLFLFLAVLEGLQFFKVISFETTHSICFLLTNCRKWRKVQLAAPLPWPQSSRIWLRDGTGLRCDWLYNVLIRPWEYPKCYGYRL